MLPSLNKEDICDAYLCGQDVFGEKAGTKKKKGDLARYKIIISKYSYL